MEITLDLLPDPVIVIDANERVAAVNGAFLRLLGYGSHEVVGGHAGLFIEMPGLPSLYGRLVPGAGLDDADASLIARDGRSIAVSLSAAWAPGGPGREDGSGRVGSQGYSGRLVAVARVAGQRIERARDLASGRDELLKRINYLEDFREGVLHMLRDLDRSERDLDEAYSRLRDTQAQLIQSSKLQALGELAAGLAHEINQPLTVIKGLAQNLQRKAVGSPDIEKLDLIVNAAGKMERIIRHLRIFSRSEGPSFEKVDINSVIRDAFLMLSETLAKSSVKVTLDLAEGLPTVEGCPNRLEQVVINLVTNARDAMPCGGELFISTAETSSGGRRCVSATVRDTGSGITEENIPRVFDPFFTTKGPGSGTGLGLSISYGIVKEHKGEITVESLPGKGTAFRVTLPAAFDQ